PTARGRDATCEIQGSVRRKHGDQHRKRNERVVVRSNQVHGSHCTPSGCHAERSHRASIKKLPDSLAPAPILAGFEPTVAHFFWGLNMGSTAPLASKRFMVPRIAFS